MFLYIINWKMYFSFRTIGQFCQENYHGFIGLSKLENKKIILCPSHTVLIAISAIFEDFELEIGAQNCSAYMSGPYTGQVSAISLAQMDCTYCIIGHSEVREYFLESDQDISEKALRLLENKIVPILCIGENKENYGVETAKKFLFAQLEPVFKKIKDLGRIRLCIAYEPIWAIGTGVTPKNEYIEKIFEYIIEVSEKICPNTEITLLYGGSVNENNVKKMKSIRDLGGLLIGGASLDFKKFEKIVQL